MATQDSHPLRTTGTRIASLLMMGGVAAGDSAAIDLAPARTTADPAAAVALAASAGASTVRVAALPLRLGYYVASDTPCGRASNATVSLLRRNGIGGSRDFCEFTKIDRTSPRTYRVTQACRTYQDSGPPDIGTVTYTLSGDARFTSRSASGWTHSARHCPPSSLPAVWRQNDAREPPG